MSTTLRRRTDNRVDNFEQLRNDLGPQAGAWILLYIAAEIALVFATIKAISKLAEWLA